MKRKLFSLLLSLAMVVTMMPVMTITAFATGHSHDGIEFVETDKLPTSPGSYYLTKDISISKTWDVPTGGDVNLCLNGHDIKAKATDDNKFGVISIKDGAVLNLYDCQAKGLITGGNATSGAGVLVYKGKFTMNGGKIANNKATSGAGIYVGTSGNFIMNGGKITGNVSKFMGGGICVLGDATLVGGEISKNKTSECGGGVFYEEGWYKSDHYTGNLILGGTINIIDNTLAESTTENLYIGGDSLIKFGTGSNEPKDGMNVGITTKTKPTFTNPVAITSNCNPEYAAYLSADNSKYLIIAAEDHLELMSGPESDFATGDQLILGAKRSGSKTVKLSWNKVNGATKYVVYGAKSGNKLKKLKTTTKKSYTVKKISGKKMKANKRYKFKVVANTTNGKVTSKTITIKVK